MRRAPHPILIATNSADKAAELRAILAPVLQHELRTLAELDVPPPEDDIEIHHSFRANAIAKARYFAGVTGMTVMSDDSGIVVHALGGLPGVHSKRFSRRTDLHGRALDHANNTLLLDRLVHMPAEDRTAHYTCAAVWLEPDHAPVCTLATVTGEIAHAPAGTAGFGYDPIFFFPPLDRTFAQLAPSVKNQHSHRGRAIRALAASLAQIP